MLWTVSDVFWCLTRSRAVLTTAALRQIDPDGLTTWERAWPFYRVVYSIRADSPRP